MNTLEEFEKAYAPSWEDDPYWHKAEVQPNEQKHDYRKDYSLPSQLDQEIDFN